MQQYKVRDHDSLWRIARHFGVTVDALAAANHLKGRQLHWIKKDQLLNIPDKEDDTPDTYVEIYFRAINFSAITPKKVKVAHDGKEEEHRLTSAHLTLSIYDHSRGLKVWVEALDKTMEQLYSATIVPIGKWRLFIDSRQAKVDGSLQQKKGPSASTTPEVKAVLTHNAKLADGDTQQQQVRTEAGAPSHGLATIYTEKNLRLLPGNEQYRKYIIAAAEKYHLSPQTLAALIDAEAAKLKGGVWYEKSNSNDTDLAQGLAQFFEAAWEDVYNDTDSLLYKDCQKLGKSERLKKRLEAKYAIDGAASYNSRNLKNFEKQTGFQVTSLPDEEKAKFAYLLHHEGLKGALRLFGIEKQLSPSEMTKRLRKQIGEDNEKKLNSLLDQYGDNPADAYKGWLFTYIDSIICINHFVIQEKTNFAQEPRKIADISLSLKLNAKTPEPKPKSNAPQKKTESGVKPQMAPATPVTQTKPAAGTAATRAPAPLPASSSDGQWHDPLAECTLRSAHLASKKSAMFGMTRNNGTRCHQGIDLVAAPGTPIYAVADGVVYSKKAPSDSYAYGNTLILVVGINDLPAAQAAEFRKHSPKLQTIGFFYAHLSELPEKAVMTVECGEIIGKSGATGNASNMTSIELGAHLHFEVRQDAKAVERGLKNRLDPLPFIKNCTNR